MKRLAWIIACAAFVGSAFAGNQFVELKSNANAYSEPDRSSELVEKLITGTEAKVVRLKLVSSTRENGYYNVELPGGDGKSGWVYKTYVRPLEGASSGSHSESAGAASSTGPSAGNWGDCKTVFVGGKAPQAPESTTALCEEEGGVVFFASGYSKKENHGKWSAYRFDDDILQKMDELHLKRPKITFKQNAQLSGTSYVQPRHDSYTGTNLDRGHLAPNGALTWDEDAQRRSFNIANIAPQSPGLNRQMWMCFEYSIREWAATSGNTHVVVGTMKGTDTIVGEKDPNQVAINIPSHFLAMVYRQKPSPMAIGVLVPNEEGHKDIRKFMMPVADLEKKSGYKFSLNSTIATREVDFKKWPTRLVGSGTRNSSAELSEEEKNKMFEKVCPRAST